MGTAGGSVVVAMTDRDRAVTPERDLVDRAQHGDVAAFEQLYHAHVGRVYALCLRLAGNASLAEELAQEAFVRAWRKLSSFRGKSAFSTWLYRVTVNVAITGLRTHGRRAARTVSTPDPAAYDKPVETQRPAMRLDLEHAIAGLPEGARRVFVLHDVEGYRHEEIAAMTGIAPGTSKAQLHRARRLLREALA